MTFKNGLILLISGLSHGGMSFAAEHHSGHSMVPGSAGGSATTCVKPHVSKFFPANMASVAPGSVFSFVAFNLHDPKDISVTVKKIPVEVSAELKSPFYNVRGTLPESLKNTVARIHIKITGKSAHCETENGWLVRITD
jgi:hypothetical protein